MTARLGPPVFLLISLAVWSWFFWTLKFPYVGDIWDDGDYMVSAQALRSGHGYVLPSRPGVPARPKYPIGFPVTLAAAFTVTGSSGADVAYAVVVLSAWVFGVAVFIWVRRLGAGDRAAALVAATAVFACMPRHKNVMADLPLCAVTAVLFARWTRDPTAASGGFLDGALAGFAFVLRRPGIALLPACWVRRRRPLSALAVAAGFLAVDLPLELYMMRFPATLAESYISEALRAGWGAPSALVRVFLANAASLLQTIPQTAAPFVYSNMARGFAGATTHLATIALWILLLLGLWSLRRKHGAALTPVWIFSLGTIAIIAAWPWSVGARLAMPLAPVTALVLGAGAARAWPRRGAAVLWSVLLCGSIAMDAREIVAPGAPALWARDLGQGLDFIRAHSEPDAVIVTQAPEMMWLYTRRQAIPMIDSVEEFHPGTIDSLKAWLPAVDGRPLYVLGSCVTTEDGIAIQTRAIAAQPGFAMRELFHTADCRVSVNSLFISPPRQ